MGMNVYRDRQTGRLVTLRKDESVMGKPRFFAVDVDTDQERQIFSFNELSLVQEGDR